MLSDAVLSLVVVVVVVIVERGAGSCEAIVSLTGPLAFLSNDIT